MVDKTMEKAFAREVELLLLQNMREHGTGWLVTAVSQWSSHGYSAKHALFLEDKPSSAAASMIAHALLRDADGDLPRARREFSRMLACVKADKPTPTRRVGPAFAAIGCIGIAGAAAAWMLVEPAVAVGVAGTAFIALALVAAYADSLEN